MKFTNIIKNKDFVQYLTVILTILLIVVIELISSKTNNEITNQELANMMVETNNSIEEYSILFINIKPTINAILESNNIGGMQNLIILLIESITCYIVISFIISKLYLKSVTLSMSSGIKNKKAVLKDKDFWENNIVITYVKKEFKNLVRNPIFFMQCVMPSLLFPILITLSTIFSIKETLNLEEFLELEEQINLFINNSVGFSAILLMIVFCFNFNFIAVTAISRDGENSIFMKYLPIKLEKQLMYKILPGIILNGIPVILILTISKILIPIFEFKNILYIILVSLLINIFNNYCMVIVDLKNPKLKWTSEYSVVKQNLNMLFEILLFLIELLAILLMAFKIVNINVLGIILIFIFTILNIAINKYINSKQLKLFSKVI